MFLLVNIKFNFMVGIKSVLQQQPVKRKRGCPEKETTSYNYYNRRLFPVAGCFFKSVHYRENEHRCEDATNDKYSP